MRIPLAWLREYAPTDMPADDLAELITHRGVKVEGVLYPWEGLEGVVVARVLEVRDHPNSEKLCLARLQHAAGEIELVVGVRNMAAGDLVPWAPPGARVPVLDEPLGQREIRGVVSHGMLCSPRELAISTDHGGILVLNDEGMDVGTDLKRALELDQPVLDIEVEPNRPDFLSILGVAREVAAATGVSVAAGRAHRRRRRRGRRIGGVGADRRARRLPAIPGPRDPRRDAPGHAAVGAGTPDRLRDAPDRRGRRRDELRDARARPAAARLRSRGARGAGHRRAPRDRR